jgi:hypothetical protein
VAGKRNLTRDNVLDNITAYWLTGTGASAARSYPWPGWKHDRSAWQWDAMSWLGVSSFVAAIAFAVTAWRARSSAAVIALTVQLSAATAGGLLVHASGQESDLGVALVLAGLAALGSALIVTRRRPNSQPG